MRNVANEFSTLVVATITLTQIDLVRRPALTATGGLSVKK